jgi:PAS domain S-box-containing protein
MASSESIKRLQAIFENSQDGIITINHLGIIESINPAAANLFGYKPGDVINQNIKMLMPEPDRSRHDGYINNYHTTGRKKIIGIGREVRGKCKDGSTFPFFLSVNEVKLEDRIIFTGFIHDITEIKQKEAQLEESRNRLSAIFETAVDGIIIIDKRGVIRTINPAVTRLFGYTQEELEGHNISTLMPEPHKSNHDQYIHNYQKTGQAKIIGIGREVLGKRKDGTTFPFNLGVSEVKTEDEVIYTGIIHDLTAYKKKEQEIIELNQTLEERVLNRTNELSKAVNKLLGANKQLNHEISERLKIEEALRATEVEILHSLRKEKELGELKSRFVSMASHEFRTPLSTILSSVSLIGRYKETGNLEKVDKHIDRIKSSVSNLTNILNDFLSLSKLEEGKIVNQPEQFHLYPFCNSVIEELEGILKPEQTIQLNGLEQSTEVYLDKKLLKNVLFNLLSNGLKYSPEGSTITVKIDNRPEELEIKVVDQGIGIPKADQEHLFSRFFRATNASNIQGTGLGLNIVKKYVELMGGSITFESVENVGTTFTVLLPIKAS